MKLRKPGFAIAACIALGAAVIALLATWSTRSAAPAARLESPSRAGHSIAAAGPPSERATGTDPLPRPVEAIPGTSTARARQLDDSAMLRLVVGCYKDDEQRRLMAMPGFEQMRAHGLGNATEEMKRKADADFAALKLRLAHPRTECDSVKTHMLDGSAYELMLAAANRGDREAEFCYLGASMPMSKERARDPLYFEDYRRNALRLIDAGMARGDWRMLSYALVASNPPKDLQPWNWQPFEGPRYAWAMRLREPDPRVGNLRQYSLTLLQVLGARTPEDAEGPQRTAAMMRDWISEAEARRAEEWAVTQFRTTFRGRTAPIEPEPLCMSL